MDERQKAVPPDAVETLRDRARLLAMRSGYPTVSPSSIEVLEFCLGRERYAVETRYVGEVCPLKDLTPLPTTPAFVLGITNVRGRIVPVFDLRRMFDGVAHESLDLQQIVIVEGSGLELGLPADVTVGVRLLSTDSLQSSLATLSDIRGEYLRGITAEGLVLLDVGRILADPKIIVHEEVEG